MTQGQFVSYPNIAMIVAIRDLNDLGTNDLSDAGTSGKGPK